MVAERDDDGAGQGREVDHQPRLEAVLAIPQRIGQHEPAFGIGVQHLDRLARHRGDDVARPLCRARRHVLDKADDADRIHLGLARGQQPHQADDDGGAGHVPFHVVHAGGRLDRDAAGVEGDALADERDAAGHRPCRPRPATA